MPLAAIIDWYGPYRSLDALRQIANQCGEGRWVYMAFSETARSGSVRYIGETTSTSSRFRQHHKLVKVDNPLFFLGEITSQGVSGRRRSSKPTDLRVVENALIYILQPDLNERNKSCPSDCISIYSRFFDSIREDQPIEAPENFPVMIGYNSWSQEWLSMVSGSMDR